MKKTVCLILAILLIATLLSVVSAEEEGASGDNRQMNRYNVVLVVDASGSMKDNDPDEYRFEAIELFVSLLANGGNHVGGVVFGSGVRATQDITEIKGKSEKSALIEQIRGQSAKGWTDTGEALRTAVEMLDNGADESLPSIIILLTDGITEMSDEKKTAESIEKKEDALEAARDKGYQIYTIALNCEQSANSTEMQQIANATGGEYREVTSATDLQSVFDVYYQLIYGTQSIQLVDEVVPENGMISRDFNVADVGVEEVNIVVFGKVDSCALSRPGDKEISEAEMDEYLYSAKTFTLLKVSDPDNGTWNLSVTSEPGATIKIFKIYNSNLNIKSYLATEKDSYNINDEVRFITKLLENETVIRDTSKYLGYSAVLTVKDYYGNVVYTETVSEATINGFEHKFVPKDYGTYYAQIEVDNEELNAESEKFIINVGNVPPVTVNKIVKWHITRWPFLFKTNSTLDLNGNATDNEDEELAYSIVSSTWLEEDYSLDGSKLTINNFSVSKGSFTVNAYDSMGAYCEFEVKVTSTNVGLWVVILILVGIVATLAVSGILTYKSLGIPFMGSITVENLQTGESASRQKSRGRIKLSSFQIGQTGISKKAKVYFQATGKNYVYLKSSKPLYSDYLFKKSKKIKIESSMDIRISMNQDFENGVLVRFESMLNNDLYL